MIALCRERPELVFARPANATHRYSEGPMLLLNGVQAQCEGDAEVRLLISSAQALLLIQLTAADLLLQCEAIYGKCDKGKEMGQCSETISVTVATKLLLR